MIPKFSLESSVEQQYWLSWKGARRCPQTLFGKGDFGDGNQNPVDLINGYRIFINLCTWRKATLEIPTIIL